jgi:hypothetical protein
LLARRARRVIHHAPVGADHAISRGIVAGVAVGTVFNLDGTHWVNIGLALFVGMAARYAIMTSLDRAIEWRKELIKDLMIAPANALMAARFVETMDWHGLQAAVAVALFGGSSTIIFAALLSAFQRNRIDGAAEFDTAKKAIKQARRSIPTKQIGGFPPVDEPDPEMQRLLSDLDGKTNKE